MYSNGYTPFCFTNFKKSPVHFCDNYLKSFSKRFLTNLFRVEFVNLMLSIKAIVNC